MGFPPCRRAGEATAQAQKIPIAWIGIGGIGFRSQGELNTRCMVHRDPDVSPSQQAVELGSQATSANFISALANYGKYDKGVVKAFSIPVCRPDVLWRLGNRIPAAGWQLPRRIVAPDLGERRRRLMSGQFRRCPRRQRRLIVWDFQLPSAGLAPSPAPDRHPGGAEPLWPRYRPPSQTHV